MPDTSFFLTRSNISVYRWFTAYFISWWQITVFSLLYASAIDNVNMTCFFSRSLQLIIIRRKEKRNFPRLFPLFLSRCRSVFLYTHSYYCGRLSNCAKLKCNTNQKMKRWLWWMVLILLLRDHYFWLKIIKYDALVKF